MKRIYGLHLNPNHSYPNYAPKCLWHGFKHWLAGPLMGCSCSGPGLGLDDKPLGRPSLLAADDGSCFMSRWRVEYPAREGYKDRIRLARLEDAVHRAGIEVERW